MSNLDPTQQLMLAAQMVHMGVVHPLTQQNLQLWPFTVDPDLDQANCEVDFGGQCEHQQQLNDLSPGIVQPGHRCIKCNATFGGRSVTYKWTDHKKKPGWKPDGHYAHRLNELIKAVGLALGTSFAVKVELNGSTIYPLGDTNWVMKNQRAWYQRGWQSLKAMLFKSS